MFFPERITKIKSADRVLEIGPGSTPHSRSDVYLEKIFDNEEEFRLQRGDMPPIAENNKTVFYAGGTFPFKDKEFDYVICSHVLEHVEDPEIFLKEVFRVAKRGYIEFPTSYYDFVYDIPVHPILLLYKNDKIRWMPKSDLPFNAFKPFQHFLFETLRKEHFGLVNSLREYFVQGFEWDKPVICERASDVNDICFDEMVIKKIERPAPKTESKSLRSDLVRASKWLFRIKQ